MITMAEPFSTFHSWLVGNYPADESALGALAADLAQDVEFPTIAGTWEEIQDYLLGAGYDDTRIALARRAWDQYSAERDEFDAAERRDELAGA